MDAADPRGKPVTLASKLSSLGGTSTTAEKKDTPL